ncbi:amidohydrolase family protein [Streptomyces sp. NPDC001107]
MKAGRFIVETHAHAQRVAAGGAVKEALAKARASGTRLNPWRVLGDTMFGLQPYDNSERLLFDMETYDVDMAVLLPAFGMTDELNATLVERYPDRFVAEYGAMEYGRRCRSGEIEWSIEGVVEDLRAALGTGRFVGIGEVPPYMPIRPQGAKAIDYIITEAEALRNMFRVAEVAQEFGVICRVHSGWTMGYEVGAYTGELGPININLLLVDDLATTFPDVTFVINHGGIQASTFETFFQQGLHVTAAHDNVYLETGLWWRELYEQALAQVNLGAEKLIWGTDWGASIPCVTHLGSPPHSHFEQIRSAGPIQHQSDYWGWGLNELLSVRCSQDDRNLILGGNAARIYGLPVPHSRLFRPTSIDGVARPALATVRALTAKGGEA